MRIYVDGELPKNCDDCELGYFYDCQYCSLRPDLAREDIWVEKEKHCPLLSTQSLKQQVRKEVVEDISKELKSLYKNYPIIYSEDKDIVKICYDKDSVNKILDTILKKYGDKYE